MERDTFFYCNAYSDTTIFTAEFKEHGETTNSLDCSKYIMRCNIFYGSIYALRCFTFGPTVKNTSGIDVPYSQGCLGLWYTNCSMLVSSKPLDVIKVVNTSLLVLFSRSM